jgi:hypothetical protein
MSEYYLADQQAQERGKQRNEEGENPPLSQGQDLKATLLGEFMLASGESQGFDPYNTVHGRSPRDAWRLRGRR